MPRLVEALEGIRIIGAAASGSHTVAWTDAGELLTWGRGDKGRLGHGPGEPGATDVVLVPRVVQALAGQRVVRASAASHTMALTATGRVYTFGQGSDGELGQGDQISRFTPRVVEIAVADPL